MFGSKNKIKIDPALFERIREISDAAGYASAEEFIHHVLEREIAQFGDAKSDADITEKLKGLGYIS